MARDFIAIARSYEDDILAGRIPACKWVRLACARNQKDHDRVAAGDPTFPFTFNPSRAVRVCIAAERLPHIKGPLAKIIGRDDQDRALWNPIVLEPWQCWFLTTLFGWVRTETKLRRFRIAMMFVPRKNAKSTLAATVAAYMLTSDGENGAECYCAATMRDQAKVVAEVLWEMVKRTHDFREYFGVRLGAKTTRLIEVPATAGKFMPLSSDAHTLDALNISFAIVDELHAHKTRAVWDVLNTGTGARSQPLILVTTTAGDDMFGICYELVHYLEEILQGVVADETFFGINYTIDDGDDWTEEVTWRKANPNYGVSINPEDMRSKAIKAKSTPKEQSAFKTKHLNVWVNASSPCLSIDHWKAGQSRLPTAADKARWVDELVGQHCYVGIDLAATQDLCALSFLFPPTELRTSWRVLQAIWTPERELIDRSRRDRAPYDIWVKQGWLKTSPGSSVDHRLVREEILAAKDRFQIDIIGFDPYQSRILTDQLAREDGFGEERVLDIPQTFKSMTEATKKVRGEVLDERIDAGGCPVTTWAVANAVASIDGKENMQFLKGRSRGRIDPLISLTIAMAIHLRVAKPEPTYQMLVL